MSSLVTVRRLRGLYALLLTFPPFDRWGLPKAESVKFETTASNEMWAVYYSEGGRHTISFSTTRLWSMQLLVSTMAHEMAHLKQELAGRLPHEEGKHHNAYFHKLAQRVCEKLGFDREDFV